MSLFFRNNRFKILILLLMAGLAASFNCGRQRPGGAGKPTISAQNFARLYAESLVISNSTLPPRQRQALLLQLYAKYGLTKDEFDQAHSYYTAHPDRWQKVLQLAEQYLTPQTEETEKPPTIQ